MGWVASVPVGGVSQAAAALGRQREGAEVELWADHYLHVALTLLRDGNWLGGQALASYLYNKENTK